MLKIRYILCAVMLPVLVFLSASVFADNQDDPCWTFIIQIANKTPYICELEDTSIKNGFLLSPLPILISPGNSARFSLNQTWGSEISTTYSCGGKKIKLVSRQSVCILMSGYVSGKVAYKAPGIDAKVYYTQDSSSGLFRGMINWGFTTNL